MSTQEVNINEQVRDAIAELMTPLPAPVTHGYFNRRMFLESFISKAGAGVSISADDIKEYAAITDKEFDVILKEYTVKGIVVKEANLFGAKLYKLNLTT
jgi:hypothetical protein